MRIRHKVEHDGLVFTRNSASRTYRYAVLRAVSLSGALLRAHDGAQYDLKHNRQFHECAARGEPVPGSRYDVTFQDKVRSQAWLDKPAEEHIADAEHRARQEWHRVHGERVTSWVCKGWCSRLDLAQKLAEPGDAIVAATIL